MGSRSVSEVPSLCHSQRDAGALARFAFEILISIFSCISPLKRLPPSMLSDLQSAVLSSGERWRFVTGRRFLALFLGYFFTVLVLNRCLGIPDDLFVLVAQLTCISILFFVTKWTEGMLVRAVDASSLFHTIGFFSLIYVIKTFSDFFPRVISPPPKLPPTFVR